MQLHTLLPDCIDQWTMDLRGHEINKHYYIARLANVIINDVASFPSIFQIKYLPLVGRSQLVFAIVSIQYYRISIMLQSIWKTQNLEKIA